MRVPHSRRTRLAFLAIPFLIVLLAGSALAKPCYTISNATEGDPGDGVLSPVAYDNSPVPAPVTIVDSGTTSTLAAATTTGGATPPHILRLPTFIYVPAMGWAVLAPLWLLHEGRWTHAP